MAHIQKRGGFSLVINKPMFGQRVRLRHVPADAAAYLFINDVARFEDRGTQTEIEELISVARGRELHTEAKKIREKALLT
jgi:hypothetical protein